MRCLSLLSAVAILIGSLSSAIHAEETVPSPSVLSQQLKTSLAKVRSSCVSVYEGGFGSGVIISEDGLIVTAAHMMRTHKEGGVVGITLDDGRAAQAELLGFNRETDYALLKITTPAETKWPYCELAATAPTTGGFCFTFAHPSGMLKGRPAQVRLGRITSHSVSRGKPYYLFADCNIQPGDSGGPLFSMDGKLIGMDSSAATILDFNIFPAIDQYHLDEERLRNSERWGDISKAPDGAIFSNLRLSPEVLEMIQTEFLRRFEIGYPPTVDFIHNLINENGEVELDQEMICEHMSRDLAAFSKEQEVGFGLDAPGIVKQLPELPESAAQAVALSCDGKQVGYAIAIDAYHLITKASILPGGSEVQASLGEKKITLSRVATNSDWDVALLKVETPIALQPVVWSQGLTPVTAGDLLLARNQKGHVIWNVATDESRAVTEERSIGPLTDESIISKHRAPYPTAIRHALPLTAADAGMPVFNEGGQFVGMHIARFSRTMGLIIPSEELRKLCVEMKCAPPAL